MDDLSLLADVDCVVFDFGGVLFDIDFERTRVAMMALQGYNGKPIDFSVDLQNDLFLRVDRGELVVEDFLEALRKAWGFTCSDDELIDAWNAVLIGPFEWSIRLIEEIQIYTKVVLLSNISWLHLWHVRPQCRHLLSLFDRLFLSCATGLRKPDPEAFLNVLNTMDVSAARTMLIDDSIANCRAAAGIGMQVLRVRNPHEELGRLV
jgi:FMN phosphatase YigB (HAD superfamily)